MFPYVLHYLLVIFHHTLYISFILDIIATLYILPFLPDFSLYIFYSSFNFILFIHVAFLTLFIVILYRIWILVFYLFLVLRPEDGKTSRKLGFLNKSIMMLARLLALLFILKIRFSRDFNLATYMMAPFFARIDASNPLQRSGKRPSSIMTFSYIAKWVILCPILSSLNCTGLLYIILTFIGLLHVLYWTWKSNWKWKQLID